MDAISSALSLGKNISDAYGINSSAQTGAQQAKSATHKSGLANTSDKNSGKDVNSEQIALSPRALRAQRIDAMSKDFFAKGNFSVSDIPKLVQRLHQDGILSDSQLSKLSHAGFDVPAVDKSTAALSDFIDEQSQTLQDQPENPLLVTLHEAKAVLSQVGDAQSPVLAQKATRVAGQINQFLNSDAPISDQARKQWQGLRSVMQLTASMGEHQLAGGQLSSYLALASR